MYPDRKLTTLNPDRGDKEAFYEWASQYVYEIPDEDWDNFVGDTGVQDTIAWVCSVVNPLTNTLELEIGINARKLALLGTDSVARENIKQVLVRHETSELWADPERSYAANGYAHQMALLDEWQLAFELDCQDTYMFCIRKWAEEIGLEQGIEAATAFLQENEAAYLAIASQR